jgi:hypothetical protein
VNALNNQLARTLLGSQKHPYRDVTALIKAHLSVSKERHTDRARRLRALIKQHPPPTATSPESTVTPRSRQTKSVEFKKVQGFSATLSESVNEPLRESESA